MKSNNLESQLKKEIAEDLLYKALSEEIEKELLLEYDEEDIQDDVQEYEEYDEQYEEEDDDDDEAEKAVVKNQRVKSKNKRKNKKRINFLKKDVKAKTIILVIMTLLVNTYAWFIYVSTVSTSIQMHIKGWNFEITNIDDDEFIFQVEEVYPGMDTVSKSMTAKNLGETDARLTCEFQEIRVFDEVFKNGDPIAGGNGATYTSADLFNLLKTYPFQTNIYIGNTLYDGDSIDVNSGTQLDIKFEISWQYEVGTTEEEIEAQDKIDTEWGEKAYDFMSDPANAGNKYNVEVKLKVIAEQVDV